MSSHREDTGDMTEFSKRYEADEAFREVADLLYGGGSDVIHKRDKSQAERERTEARIGLASNVVGLGAGVAGTGAALRDDRFAEGGKVARKLNRFARKIPAPISSKTGKAGAALAGGALGLQVANIGGDIVANRVLSRSAKKPVKKNFRKIEKSEPGSSDLHLPTAGKLKRVAAQKGAKMGASAAKDAAPTIKGGALKVVNQTPDLGAKVKEIGSKRVKKSFDVTWEGEISKVNKDQQQVFGWASIVEMNGEPVVDLQGDYISIEEVEKSAYEYVQKSRKGGDMHLRDTDDQPIHASEMIESFIVTPEKKKALGMPESTPTGWWVGYQVNDPEVWEKVKSGERTGFSIHGKGVRS